jgi:parvulin-like peptidyl-prolyl isomerase
LQQVIDSAYVKELAARNGVSVKDSEINDAIAILRTQNQLGNDNTKLASVTKKFFGWSVQDLRRQLKQELLAQKVAAKLDTEAYRQAQNVLLQLRAGGDFTAIAAQSSDDAGTKANGGQYGDTAITFSSQEVPPVIVRALSQMQPGEVSDIITTQTAFEIVKLLGVENGKYKAAHIQIQFKDIQTYLQPLEKDHPPKRFISVKTPE